MSEKTDKLDELKNKCKSCCKCKELCENRNNVVFGVGNPEDCKVVIIGEAPGKREDLQNEPFVGRSGQILNSLLEETGLSREDVYITNTILCRPPENRDPTEQELKNCKPRLDKQIKILNPKVVITLGNFATKYMLDTKKGITSLKGKIYERDGIKIVPMFHPAVLLYNGNSPEKRKEFLKDFEPIKQLLGKSKTLKDFC